MRHIDYIIIHCTATNHSATVSAIQRYWRDELGWNNPGYHYLIDATGRVHQLLDEKRIANGVRGYNHNSIHMAYIGGIDPQGNPCDNRTNDQINAMFGLIVDLIKKYPNAKLRGHRDFLNVGEPGYKFCPSFNVTEYYSGIL